MNPRLVALLLCLSIALTVGCSAEARTEPTPTLEASPVATIFAPLEPTPTYGPAETLITPLTTEPHKLGTRTGNPKVDAVIAAFEARDAAALAAQISFYPIPCTEPVGIGALPCPVGAPVGTPVSVFGYGGCEGTWITATDPSLPAVIPGFMVSKNGTPFDARIYAIIQGRLFPGEPIPGDTVIIYNSGLVMAVDQTGLTYISSGCEPKGTGKVWLENRIARQGSQSYVLRPLK